MVRGVGLEPSENGDIAELAKQWRYHRYSFFAASLPLFSLLGKFADQVESLAGDEKNEWKKLSPFGQDVAWRVRERSGALNSQRHQMSQMWQPEAVERWKQEDSDGRSAALFVQSLLASVLPMVSRLPFTPFFFFSKNRSKQVLGLVF